MNFKKIFISLMVILSLISLGGCKNDLDRIDSNIYLKEETSKIDNEYIFTVVEIMESSKYVRDEIEYDSKYENGVFITLKIIVKRLNLEKTDDKSISPAWFKVKIGAGFTVWNSSLGETIKANEHIDALKSSFETFTPDKGTSEEIFVVFDIGEKYLDTDRVLTLEIDRPWSAAGALEVVLIERPIKAK